MYQCTSPGCCACSAKIAECIHCCITGPSCNAVYSLGLWRRGHDVMNEPMRLVKKRFRGAHEIDGRMRYSIECLERALA
ncbi:hypothetical protein VTO73DRAFT_10027 [Trametes versicolor]